MGEEHYDTTTLDASVLLRFLPANDQRIHTVRAVAEELSADPLVVC